MTALPSAFLDAPLAHRALHDRQAGRPENSLSAVRAALRRGYGIEIDVQPSADGAAMVFHDHDLRRLTGEAGPIAGRRAAELGRIRLTGTAEGIPTLEEVLEAVNGAVPILIEIKDQDGAMGRGVGPLERAVARTLAGYAGDVAVMSFNPHAVAALAEAAPQVPRGLTTCAFAARHWPALAAALRDRLRAVPDYDRVGASFVSHRWSDLARPRIADLRDAGAAILCWTVKSAREEQLARRLAQNVTFEGYPAAIPAAAA